MTFTHRLKMYHEMQTKFTSSPNYLFLMRFVMKVHDEDEKQMTGKTYQQIKQEITNYSVEIAGTDPETGEYRNQVAMDKLEEEVDATNFEW